MKKLFLLSVLMLLPILASADAVEINGIYYNLIKGEFAEVTSNPNQYTGNVVIPESVVYEGKTYSVTSIGGYAFEYCSGLTSLTIPNSVTTIGGYAFSHCSGLTSVTIPNSVTTIGGYAFNGCSGLTSLTIPNSVTSIGDSAFSGCGLTSLTIPNSVTTIGGYAFYRCRGLTSVTIGNSVTTIGGFAFSGCGLTSLTIPNSVTSIGDNAFSYCSGLTSLTIPNSVTSIGDHAFSYCSGLTSLTIPNSVTSIGDYAFEYCSGLTSVTIPDCVTSIGNYAFEYCSGLTSVTIPNSVTTIGECTFRGCSGLTSVTIPNSVTFIRYAVFSGCSGLTSVTIPNSVTTIGDSAFSGCGLTSVTIPNSVTSIGSGAFSSCSGLTSLTIPNSVTSIGYNAFSSCSGLTSLTIPNSVTSIGDYAFRNCSGLTSVTIPNSVTTIGRYAFSGCSGLTSVTIPNSVTTIGEYAFNGCSGLTSVTIGSGVISIGKEAFAECKELKVVYCLAENVPNTTTDAFKDSYIEYSTLHVPVSSVDAYKAREPWKNFGTIVPLEGTTTSYKLTYLIDNEVYKEYSFENGAEITPEPAPTKEGYTFSGWSEIPATMPAYDVTVTGSFIKNIDVGDLACLLNYIMNRLGSEYNQQYDLNSDGELNIGDVILMIKKIHENQANTRAMARRAKNHHTTETDLSKFTAAQFVVKIAEGARVETIGLKGQNCFTHKLSYEPIGDGIYSVVVYSTSNQLLANDESGFIEVVFADDTKSEVTISDVMVSTPESECMWMESLLVGSTTAINSIENKNSCLIYDLKGNRLDVNRESVNSLPKGIYIMNGKKKVVK